MRELAEGTDSYGADVVPASAGLWHFRIEAWGDPIAHWRHDAAIKVPIGQDVDLMLAEGALLFDRAAREADRAARRPMPARRPGQPRAACTRRSPRRCAAAGRAGRPAGRRVHRRR